MRYETLTDIAEEILAMLSNGPCVITAATIGPSSTATLLERLQAAKARESGAPGYDASAEPYEGRL